MDEFDRLARNERDIALVAQDVRRLDEKVNVFAPTAAMVSGLQADIDDLKRSVEALGVRISHHGQEVFGAVERLRGDMNGRLRALELWRAGLAAVGRTFRWLPTVLGATLAATVSGVLVYVFTH